MGPVLHHHQVPGSLLPPVSLPTTHPPSKAPQRWGQNPDTSLIHSSCKAWLPPTLWPALGWAWGTQRRVRPCPRDAPGSGGRQTCHQKTSKGEQLKARRGQGCQMREGPEKGPSEPRKCKEKKEGGKTTPPQTKSNQNKKVQ